MFIKHNKYRNVKVKSVDGTNFDSRLEYKHFLDLSLLQRAGKILDLQRQVTIPLGLAGKVKYRADFVFLDLQMKKWIIWDSKGVITKEFRVKREWLLETYKNFVFKQVGRGNIEVFTPTNESAKDFAIFIAEKNETKRRKNAKK